MWMAWSPFLFSLELRGSAFFSWFRRITHIQRGTNGDGFEDLSFALQIFSLYTGLNTVWIYEVNFDTDP